MNAQEIVNESIFVAAAEFVKVANDKNELSFHVFHLTGDKIMSGDEADKWLDCHYTSLGVDYENDRDLTAILEMRKQVLHAISKGQISVHY